MAQKIGLAEYEKQRSEYTKKALEELNEQMKTYSHGGGNIASEELDDSGEEEFMTRFSHKRLHPDKKSCRGNEYDTILELSKKVSTLENELEKEEVATHYLKLDLSNVSCELEKSKDDINFLKGKVEECKFFMNKICIMFFVTLLLSTCSLFVFDIKFFIGANNGFYLYFVTKIAYDLYMFRIKKLQHFNLKTK